MYIFIYINLYKSIFYIKKNKGQSVLEVIIAMAIFALISATMISMVLGSVIGLEKGGEKHMKKVESKIGPLK